MLNSSVLVLNRSYLPIHVTSVRRAFAMVYQDLACVVNDRYETFDFDGRLWQLHDSPALPKPAQAGGPPIIVGRPCTLSSRTASSPVVAVA